MRLILMSANRDIEANEDEKYDFVIKIVSSDLSFEEIVNWIKQNTIQ